MVLCKLVVEGHAKFASIVIERFPELVPCYGLSFWSQARGSRIFCQTLQNVISCLLKVVLKAKIRTVRLDTIPTLFLLVVKNYLLSCILWKQLWTCKRVVKRCTQGFNIKWVLSRWNLKTKQTTKNFLRTLKMMFLVI